MKKREEQLGFGADVITDPELRAARAFFARQIELFDDARQRFYGSSTKDVARWILDLIQQPAETVRSLWEIRCAIEVTAFAAIQGGAIEANAITLRELQFHQIEPILDRLRGALAALAHGQQPPAFDVRVGFSFGIDWDTDGTFDIQDRTDEIVDGFLWGVLKTLREARRDIRLCARPKCGTWYVKSTAGLYHSAACSQRVRTDKWLGRKREEAPKGKTTTTKLGRRRGK